MLNCFLIAAGSALGGLTRYLASGFIANRFGQSFPWGTLIVNVTGSFLIGVFASLTAPQGRWIISPQARNFFMIGVFGGYTTFSSFSLQTLSLAQDREWLYAGGNILMSVLLCLISVWIGHALGEILNGR